MNKLYSISIIQPSFKQKSSFINDHKLNELSFHVANFIKDQPTERKKLGLDSNLKQFKNELSFFKKTNVDVKTFNILKMLQLIALVGSLASYTSIFIIIMQIKLSNIQSFLAWLLLGILWLMTICQLFVLGFTKIVKFVKDIYGNKLMITIFNRDLHTVYKNTHDLKRVLSAYDYDRYQKYYLHHLLPDSNIFEQYLNHHNFILIKTVNNFLILNRSSNYKNLYAQLKKPYHLSHAQYVLSIFGLMIMTLFTSFIYGFFEILCSVFFFAGGDFLLSFTNFKLQQMIINGFSKFIVYSNYAIAKTIIPGNSVLADSSINPTSMFTIDTIINRNDINESKFLKDYSFDYITTYDASDGLILEKCDNHDQIHN